MVNFMIKKSNSSYQQQNTKRKGDISEIEVLLAYKRAGYIVSVPWGENVGYDLLVDNGKKIDRVQVKTGRFHKNNNTITFETSNITTKEGNIIRKNYIKRADIFAIYSPDFDEVYCVPVNDTLNNSYNFSLRLSRPKNNQKKGIRYAQNYIIKNLNDINILSSGSSGVEHSTDNRVVGGSNPPRWTIKNL